VKGVTDLMVNPGQVNLDFADIRTVMAEMGKAMMGTGEAEGDERAVKAAEAAISNPLLEDTSMRGARGVLISLTGGYDLTLFEVDEAVNRIRKEVDDEANIIFGSSIDETLNGRVRVSVVATGIDLAVADAAAPAEPAPRLSLVTPPPLPRAAPAPSPAATMPRRPNTVLGNGPGVLRAASNMSGVQHQAPPQVQGALAMQAAPAEQELLQPMPAPQPVYQREAATQRQQPVLEPQPPAGFRGMFRNVTGLMKRQLPAAPEAPAPRLEPVGHPRPLSRQAAQDEMDIPAFLRRQSN